jgi:hypothetical protein
MGFIIDKFCILFIGTLTARLGLIKVKNMRLTFDFNFMGAGA